MKRVILPVAFIAFLGLVGALGGGGDKQDTATLSPASTAPSTDEPAGLVPVDLA